MAKKSANESKAHKEQDESTAPDKTSKVKAKANQLLLRAKSFVKISRYSRRQKIAGLFIAVLLITGGTAPAVPSSRYAILNVIGSADATLVVKNSVTQNPVKGVTVTLSNGDSAVTDDDGVAFFKDTEYGTTQATLTKDSYDSATVDITISKDNIQLGDFLIVPRGIPVKIEATDWLTGERIADFTVVSDDKELSAEASEGVAVLNIPNDSEGTLQFSVECEGYNDSPMAIDASDINRDPASEQDQSVQKVEMVISGRHHFVSNRDGDIGFYSSNFDGSDVDLLVSTEKDLSSFNSYPIEGTSNVFAAVLPSNDLIPHQLDQLAIIKSDERRIDVVDEVPGEKLNFSIVSVSSNIVLYRVTYKDDRSDKYKIKTYNIDTGKLATHYVAENYFWPTYDSDRSILYLVDNNSGQFGYDRLVRVDLKTGKEAVLATAPNINIHGIRQDFPDKLLYRIDRSADEGYYLLDLQDNNKKEHFEEFPEADEPEEIPDSEKGQASPSNVNRVWIDSRDGRSRLVLNNSDNLILGQVRDLSVHSIIRWVDDTKLTVSASDGSETADFIVDVETGNYRKITNSFSSGHQYWHP